MAHITGMPGLRGITWEGRASHSLEGYDSASALFKVGSNRVSFNGDNLTLVCGCLLVVAQHPMGLRVAMDDYIELDAYVRPTPAVRRAAPHTLGWVWHRIALLYSAKWQARHTACRQRAVQVLNQYQGVLGYPVCACSLPRGLCCGPFSTL